MHPADGRVVSNFIVQALKGEPITLYGDGNQTRSFCYVDDLIEGFIRLMESPADVTGPVNLGNPVEFTMRELAELVLEGNRLEVEAHKPCRYRRTTRVSASQHRSGKAKARLGAKSAATRRPQVDGCILQEFCVDGFSLGITTRR